MKAAPRARTFSEPPGAPGPDGASAAAGCRSHQQEVNENHMDVQKDVKTEELTTPEEGGRRRKPARPAGSPIAGVSGAPGSAPDAGELSREDYEKLLDMYDVSFKNLAEGEVVRGKVLKVLPSEVIVDVGYKSEGIIDIDEFTDAAGRVHVAVGDQVDVLLEKTENKEGYVVLSKEKAEKMKVWEEVERAYTTGTVITGRVIERIKGGLAVDIGVRAFLPGSLVDIRPVPNLDSLKNKEFRMSVIKVNKRCGTIEL